MKTSKERKQAKQTKKQKRLDHQKNRENMKDRGGGAAESASERGRTSENKPERKEKKKEFLVVEAVRRTRELIFSLSFLPAKGRGAREKLLLQSQTKKTPFGRLT
jgi:hypothetical protein